MSRDMVTAAMAAGTASAAALWMYFHYFGELQTDKESRIRMHQLHMALAELEERVANPQSRVDGRQWKQTLQEAIPAIVTIRVMAVKHFDGEQPNYMVATGFIVDKERGIILTNRHVVTPGPVVADAIFVNNEEVDLIPIYRDPVHDFGFFRFDPSRVQFLTVKEIPLAPEQARVGTEIRVVGNDNGEKVQILPGVLAKLDRGAPQYGLSGYNDFNTFYYAAASSTSGGSSGSPVLNANGEAVALNAGGATNAASSYYLPLDRVQRALNLLQEGKAISRGTWQTIFRHVAFDEARALGLTKSNELAIRAKFPNETGVLVVDQVVPQGPADEHLEVGDIVIQLNGNIVTTFLALESTLDESVGSTLPLEIQRGGKSIQLSLTVQDLHSITPNRFLTIGQCLLHDLSYQQARNMALPVGGVYLASAGHMLYKADIYDPCIIVAVDNTPTNTLDDFIEAVRDLPHGYRTNIQYFFPTNRHVIESAVISLDRQWFLMQLFTRNDQDGIWHPHVFDAPTRTLTMEVPSTNITPLQTDEDWSTKLLSSMVFVRFDTPLTIDGISMTSYDGVGYIIDVAQGLVLVDQYTVPVALGECTVTIAGTMQIPAKIRFVHPIHNFSIIQYDPALVNSSLLTELDLTSDARVRVGDTLRFVGFTRSLVVLTMNSVVTKVERLVTSDFKVARYKPSNTEVLSFDLMSSSSRGGVLVDESGAVVALYLAFVSEDSNEGQGQAYAYGFPVHLLKGIVHTLRSGVFPSAIQWLPVEFSSMSLSDARAGLGLKQTWLELFETKYDDTRQMLTVMRPFAGTQASKALQSGDVLLAIDGKVVAKDEDVAAACDGKLSVNITLVRNKIELVVPVDTCALSCFGTNRVFIWAGMLIQAPHLAVLQRGYIPEEGGVYCSQWFNGSPADKFLLHAARFIVEVNDVPTPTLDAFKAAVSQLKHGDSVRMKTYDLESRPEMATLKIDCQYWPTMEILYCTKSDRWVVNP